MLLPIRAAYGLLNRLLFSGAFGDVSLRRALLIFLPKEPFHLIDIGACDGDFYEALSREKKIAAAVLVEPRAAACKAMQKRFRGRPRLTILQDLLCSEAKKVDLHVNSVGDTSSIFTAIDSRIGAPIATETITSRTLDDAAEALQGSVGLLKIDVQGAELEVLKGGEKTLARTEFVWIEVSWSIGVFCG